MKKFFPLLLGLAILMCGASTCHTADPPAPTPAAPVIRWPLTPPTPVPPSPPAPVTKLGKGQLYLVPTSAPVLLVASRENIVKISQLNTADSAVTVFGDFVDPLPGDDEGRTFAKGVIVYVIRATAAGQVELIAARDLSGKAVERRLLDVDGGGPAPGPGPGPKPPDPPTPVAGPLWIVAIVDNSARTPAIGKVLADTAMEKRLLAAGHRWKVYDPAETGSPAADPAYKKFIDEAGGLPCLLVLDKTGKRLKAVRFPADSAGVEKVVADALGGK